uniref:Uncharacterized protein n=1 Tax=Rhizophora mucronata TaxID=61149 RepID=A0A2P2MV43_RHIMU
MYAIFPPFINISGVEFILASEVLEHTVDIQKHWSYILLFELLKTSACY